MYEIEKGINPPRAKKRGQFTEIAAQMNVGDCVQVADRRESELLRQALFSYGFKDDTTGMARKQPDGTYRVWKIRRPGF